MIYKNFSDCRKNLANVRAIDYFFAKEITDFLKINDEKIFHILIALSESFGQGHSCLDLSTLEGQILWQDDGDDFKKGYSFENIAEAISSFEKFNSKESSPIIYKFNHLYIKKIWNYENEIVDFVVSRLTINSQDLSIEKIKIILDKLFKKTNTVDYQKIAVTNALVRDFSIISGGPGTGKTTTIGKLIEAFQHLSESKLNIELLAPTGKAANRLSESLGSIEFKPEINCNIRTIHRFLGVRSDSIKLKYSKDNKSECDVLIIDEASMLDISLFIKILRAIKDDCKVVLVGDVNQLPSIEAGSLFQELISMKSKECQILKTKSLITNLTGFNDFELTNEFSVYLHKNYRSNQEIANFAKNVISAKDCFKETQEYESINFVKFNSLEQQLKSIISKYYSKLLLSKDIGNLFAILKSFRILVANKNAHIGTENLNKKVVAMLGKRDSDYFNGKPIMITENSYSQGVFNGDVGIVYDGRVWFETGGGKYKDIGLSSLPKHETAYVMTIHKTQGSEFNEIMIILPAELNKILTNKLLYTGITRAKNSVMIIANENIWQYAVANKQHRSSNIAKLLGIKYL